jgi:hypothetical protein
MSCRELWCSEPGAPRGTRDQRDDLPGFVSFRTRKEGVAVVLAPQAAAGSNSRTRRPARKRRWVRWLRIESTFEGRPATAANSLPKSRTSSVHTVASRPSRCSTGGAARGVTPRLPPATVSGPLRGHCEQCTRLSPTEVTKRWSQLASVGQPDADCAMSSVLSVPMTEASSLDPHR